MRADPKIEFENYRTRRPPLTIPPLTVRWEPWEERRLRRIGQTVKYLSAKILGGIGSRRDIEMLSALEWLVETVTAYREANDEAAREEITAR